MGYYTYYNIEVEEDKMGVDDEKIAAIYAKAKELDLEFTDVFDQSLCSWDCCKWYECEEEMKRLSSFFPEVMFTVFGNGEAEDDFWIAHFKDGKEKFRQGQIVYPTFDEVEWR